MPNYTNLLICKDANCALWVARCDSWRAEIGALAVVDGALLEICNVNCVELNGDEYRFISQLHDIKDATAIYTKTWEKEEAIHGDTAD